jgi:signal transduction histidine kinase
MKIERFRQLDYQLKPRLANYPRAVFDRANVDPTMLQMAAQQDERKRIAQELHDTLLQGFTGIAVKLDALTTSLPPSLFDVKQQLQQTLEQMYGCLGETRGSIWSLRSPRLLAENR